MTDRDRNESWITRLGRRAVEPWDIASLAAFRILFGLLMAATVVRYVQMGWIERFYVEPSFHFSYWGLEWVQAPPAWGLYAMFAAMFVLGLCIAAGLFYRVATVAFLLVFTYVELIDVTNYLNHYYQVSLLALILSVLPLHRTWSVDAWRRPELRASALPAWMTWLLRFQVGIVYFYAALAKVGPDWLLHGQPLGIWLAARTDAAVVGPWLDVPWVALAMSWAGFLHDLLIVPALLWRRSRPFAYAVLVVFHAATGYLFQIGIFPFLMIVTAVVFFSPSWPRKVLARLGARPSGLPGSRVVRGPRSRWVALGLGAYCLVQVLVPLRFHLYGGDVLWHEQGMRWSWKVLVREKKGAVTYRVTLPNGREVQVPPRHYLDVRQEREMAGQPDLILQLAHRIGEDFRERGYQDVEVRAEALVSLNGRPPEPMIDPQVDLLRVEDGLAPADWILPAPQGSPAELHKPSGRLGRTLAKANDGT